MRWLLLICVGLVFFSCEKDEPLRVEDPDPIGAEWTVPDIPPEIEAYMTEYELIRFKQGPGEKYLNAVTRRSGRWHPVLMLLDYDLQLVPIGGTSCEPGQFRPCLGPGAPMDPTACLAQQVGFAGQTYAVGRWLRNPVRSEVFPVFCGPDFAGYGQGYYEVDGDQLRFTFTSTRFVYDPAGNMTFFRYGDHDGAASTGVFQGAMGWDFSRTYTPVEGNPETTGDGTGFSKVLTFGWVYY